MGTGHFFLIMGSGFFILCALEGILLLAPNLVTFYGYPVLNRWNLYMSHLHTGGLGLFVSVFFGLYFLVSLQQKKETSSFNLPCKVSPTNRRDLPVLFGTGVFGQSISFLLGDNLFVGLFGIPIILSLSLFSSELIKALKRKTLLEKRCFAFLIFSTASLIVGGGLGIFMAIFSNKNYILRELHITFTTFGFFIPALYGYGIYKIGEHKKTFILWLTFVSGVFIRITGVIFQNQLLIQGGEGFIGISLLCFLFSSRRYLPELKIRKWFLPAGIFCLIVAYLFWIPISLGLRGPIRWLYIHFLNVGFFSQIIAAFLYSREFLTLSGIPSKVIFLHLCGLNIGLLLLAVCFILGLANWPYAYTGMMLAFFAVVAFSFNLLRGSKKIAGIMVLFMTLLFSHDLFARPLYTYSIPGRMGRDCLICHESFLGGGKRNNFGCAFQEAARYLEGVDKKFHHPEDAMILILPEDSDGDGFTNREELEGNTYPGLRNSFPGRQGSPGRGYLRFMIGHLSTH